MCERERGGERERKRERERRVSGVGSAARRRARAAACPPPPSSPAFRRSLSRREREARERESRAQGLRPTPALVSWGVVEGPGRRLSGVRGEGERVPYHLHPGKAIFVSFAGNESYYTNADY